ncbi:UPF0488 protein CG14286 [Papilio machaon]|uniref:UPF0488 protein CG14286 n=1 Tax=Papilio machaon TaxID=76193 RepID=A0A194RJW8_PAPMA|nr:UPF0488 protein CG14286 [Papilio machaon]
MPKPVKLHSKGKPNSIQKANKLDKDNDNKDPEEATREFQLQLCWCIQQLERSLHEKKGNEKHLQEAWKVLTILKNNNQPIIRKRQLMRTHFGDYRAKMAAEEKKLIKMASKFKISESPVPPKATFLRKSVFSATGDESFRFNFNIPPENLDNGNTNVNSDNTDNINSTESNDNQLTANVASVEKNDDKNEVSAKSEQKNFKFTFSSSSFKFNFPIDDS